MGWIVESNRKWHVLVGLVSALFGTIVGAVEVGLAMEAKDCHHSYGNASKPIRKWVWKAWDWLDFLATVLGGLVGQAVQLLVVWLVFF